MGIVWIGFACNLVIDLLKLFGLITKLPVALLALTIIAWGNELGDLTADVAMTKRGFGEMAITATIAGPIFNIAIGAGLSNTVGVIKFGQPINFGFYQDGVYNKVAILPFVLMIGQLVTLVMILINGITNNFKISFKQSAIQGAVYLVIVISLVAYCLVADVKPPSD